MCKCNYLINDGQQKCKVVSTKTINWILITIQFLMFLGGLIYKLLLVRPFPMRVILV